MTYDEFNTLYKFEEKAGFKLADLQKQDIEQFLQWRRSLNTYEVGCGKTVISTVVSLMLGSDTTIVVMPPILLLGWERWLNKVSEKVLRYQGTPSERKLFNMRECRWLLVSQAIFRKDYNAIVKALAGRRVDMVIDEAQCLKSPTSIIYEKVSRLKTLPLQLLTGTPTSTPLDCYTYIKLKSPELYRGYDHFESCHVAERDFFKSVSVYQGLPLLAQRFAIKNIKRTKLEVHGYNIEPLYPDTAYELSDDHYALYKRLVEEQLLLLDDGSRIDATTATRMYHNLQQIVVNYDYFSGDPKRRSVAYDLIDQTVESTDCLSLKKSKLIIWTYYRLTSRSVLNYLKGLGYDAVGAYSEVNSSASFERFMNDPKCRILVAQPTSAGAGLNPQGVCSEALFLENSTTPMLARQSIGRLDRVGQTVRPTMRFAVAKGTIQEYLLAQLMAKDSLVSQVERTPISLRDILLGGSGE